MYREGGGQGVTSCRGRRKGWIGRGTEGRKGRMRRKGRGEGEYSYERKGKKIMNKRRLVRHTIESTPYLFIGVYFGKRKECL